MGEGLRDTAQRSNPLLKGINMINKIALAPYRTRGRALAARRTPKAGSQGGQYIVRARTALMTTS
jgi:hypothetical protein